MQLRWQIRNEFDPTVVDYFTRQLNSSPILAKILLNRGVKDIEAARLFFKPELSHLHDPGLMADMTKAVASIQEAIEKRKKVLVYGDYDVDG
ncbi:single-stranded-DNA-specific exonuclease RecJ, partial [bacterium]|nr:single-stranded-DNA-specific exonuclease RecJ [bacterium]